MKFSDPENGSNTFTIYDILPDKEPDNSSMLDEKYLSTLKKSIQDFRTNLNADSTFIYRGESEEFPTPLLPTIFRPGKKWRKPAILENNGLFESELINEFTLNYPDYSKGTFDALEYMQHYEFPTRLLDWSEDFKVALFFACLGDPSKDGFIYIFPASLTYVDKRGIKADPLLASL